MKHKTKIALASIAGAVAVGGIAYGAQGYQQGKEMRRAFAPEKIMERVDLDGDKAASTEEMTTLATSLFTAADSDADGKLTKAEIVAAIDTGSMPEPIKRRSGRVADRIVGQGDINQDGTLELDEITNRIGKFHALVDWNDDGRVELAEAKRMRGFGMRRNRGKN